MAEVEMVVAGKVNDVNLELGPQRLSESPKFETVSSFCTGRRYFRRTKSHIPTRLSSRASPPKMPNRSGTRYLDVDLELEELCGKAVAGLVFNGKIGSDFDGDSL